MEATKIPRKPTGHSATVDSVASTQEESVRPSPQDAGGEKVMKKGWLTWSHEKIDDTVKKHLAGEFNGRAGWNGRRFRRPVKQEPTPFDAAAVLERDDKGKYVYRNQLGQQYHKYDDVVTYLSPTNFVPKRLVVQATDHVFKNDIQEGDWRRTKIDGSVPLVLKVAEWALRPTNVTKDRKANFLNYVDCGLRILIAGVPLQIMLSFPTTASWEDGTVEDDYVDHPGYHWKWPKYAINPLDMRPSASLESMVSKKPSSRQRLLRPRQLIVLRDGQWILESNPDRSLSYVFISYANLHFDTNNSETGRRMVESMAAFATLQAGKSAYWLDYRCRAPKEDVALLDGDVYRLCDVIRGSSRVVVMLKGDQAELKQQWGSRMWTLPEGLLAPGEDIYFCTPATDDESTASFKVQSMHKVEMTSIVWSDPISDMLNEDGGPTRLLAEHFSGLLTLSRLEILSTAVSALGTRFLNNYTANSSADIAYALMGLLHNRIEKAPSDTLFQAIARLSLANDSDRLIERMICLFPDPRNPLSQSPFQTLAQPDLYGTHLWDIQPLCQVVGVADEDNTVLLDGCRAMHIRWKNFPRMNVKRHRGLKKLLAELFVRSGAWWFFFGINLAITYAPFFTFSSGANPTLIFALSWLVAGFFLVGIALSFAGPFAVRRLYGGQVLQSTSSLIGFEGVMPIAKLETKIFGNCSGRLSYEPSSTPFSYRYRDPHERVGVEPDWIASERADDLARIEAEIPKGQRLFTLVDTGELSVCVFSAERPPSVALVTGREGGMLRVALCSWRFKNDCLVREAVVRMQSSVEESAEKKSWLKVCLGGSIRVPEVGKV